MIVSVRDIKNGMTLTKDVFSVTGRTLYKNSTNLKYIDIEILEAFDVKEVEVEEYEEIIENNVQGTSKVKIAKKIVQKKDKETELFIKHYRKALITVENINKLAQGNANIPLLELRTVLKPLLDEKYMSLKYLSNLKFDSTDIYKYESDHSLSVGLISYAIAYWLGIDSGERMQIALAGTLHDIGMNRISSEILYSNGSLDANDFKEIQKHSLYGYKMLKSTMGLSEGALLGILQHHEREDGSGYPLKLKKDQIHINAKIIAIADIYHAMISKRNYREEYSIYQAFDQLIDDSYNKLDSLIIRIFTKKMVNLRIGTKVILNNGLEGNIIKIDDQFPTRPTIKAGNSIIDLMVDKKYYIKYAL